MSAVNLREWCLDQIDYEEDLLFAEGFDEAILGVTYQQGHSVVVYDRDRCVRLLMSSEDMDLEEAEEFFEVNVMGSYFGPKTPLFVSIPALTYDN